MNTFSTERICPEEAPISKEQLSMACWTYASVAITALIVYAGMITGLDSVIYAPDKRLDPAPPFKIHQAVAGEHRACARRLFVLRTEHSQLIRELDVQNVLNQCSTDANKARTLEQQIRAIVE